MCQSGGDAHCILFCYATLHELLRQCVGVVAQGHRTTGISSNGDDILILTCQFEQRVGKLFSTSNHNFFYFSL